MLVCINWIVAAAKNHVLFSFELRVLHSSPNLRLIIDWRKLRQRKKFAFILDWFLAASLHLKNKLHGCIRTESFTRYELPSIGAYRAVALLKTGVIIWVFHFAGNEAELRQQLNNFVRGEVSGIEHVYMLLERDFRLRREDSIAVSKIMVRFAIQQLDDNEWTITGKIHISRVTSAQSLYANLKSPKAKNQLRWQWMRWWHYK